MYSPLFKRNGFKYTFHNSQIPKIQGKIKYINPNIANEISKKELKSNRIKRYFIFKLNLLIKFNNF